MEDWTCLGQHKRQISNGYGSAKNTTIRIGHIGDLTCTDIKALIADNKEALEEMKQ